MRTKISDTNVIALNNGWTLKGSYSLSLGGLHVSLYLIDTQGYVIANRVYGFAISGDHPSETLKIMMGSMHQLIVGSKFEIITEPRIQQAAARSLLQVLTKSSVFKSAA